MLYLPSFIKRCSKCDQYRLLSDFQRYKKSKDGLQYYCRECQNASNARAYQIHKDKTLARQKQRREENPELFRERQRRFNENHREWRRAYDREWKRKRRQTQAGVEYTRAMCRYHWSRRGDRYRKQVPAERRRNRRPKVVPGVFNGDDVQRQYEAQNGLCYWCGRDLNGDFQPDHVIPIARGGSNSPSNIVCACSQCNQSKGAKLPDDWIDGK